MKNDLLYRKSRLYVSDKNELQKILVQKIHKHSIIDYLKIQRTKISVQKNYY